MTTPLYYLPIMPYIIVEDAKGFIKFLKNVFGAEEKLTMPREDGTVMHGEMAFGKAVIMFAQADKTYQPFPCSMFLLIENIDSVYHAAMENGAKSLQAPIDRDHGRSAGIMDAFGNMWWLTRPVK